MAIGEDPKLAVMFLVSMINPFIAYLLIFMQKRLALDAGYAAVNLSLLIAAQMLLQNVWYILLLGFLLYKTLKTYGITLREAFKKEWNNKFLGTVSGSLVVMALAGICLFATVRIAMH